MNAAEIKEAISALVEQPFDQAGFPFAFLDAFGTKEATNDEISHFQPDVNKLTELCRSEDLFKTLKARF